MYEILEGQKNISVTLGDMQFSAKDCIVTSVNIEQEHENREMVSDRFGKQYVELKCPEPTTITIECKVLNSNTFFELFEGTPKISKKLVKDCSINELLFAVRMKLNKEK